MGIDFILRNARVEGFAPLVDIAFAGARIAAIEPTIVCDAPQEDAAGRLVFGGFCETHIHLDKAGILDRCRICAGTLAEAVAETAGAKARFTQDDVYARAAGIVEKAIIHGTSHLRSFVEIDPRAGFRSFEAIKRIKADYAFAIDIEICAFAQEGLTNEPQTEAMLAEALAGGADLVGGCPYTDPAPDDHIARIFDLAERFAVRVDFHADFDLDPRSSALPAIIEETRRRGLGGRVSVGHATKLSAMAPAAVDALGRQLAGAGVAVTVLPATDLFLGGRDRDRLVPRGVAPAHRLAELGVLTSIATNNVMNPFTPYGDASLIRMANLFANVAQLSRDEEIRAVFDMVAAGAGRMMGRRTEVRVDGPADLVVLDAPEEVTAVREIAQPLTGWKRGRRSFVRPKASICRVDPAEPGSRPKKSPEAEATGQ